MENFVIVAILAAILGFAARYVWKAKKSGTKCIGCPNGCTCGSKEGGCSGCGCGGETL